MKDLSFRRIILGIAAIWLSFAVTASAVIIYNNSTNDLTARFNPGSLEIGDQIGLAGTERFLTSFSFEFYGTNSVSTLAYSGTPQAKVRFYVNDGPLFSGYQSPGTLFFDSGWISLGTVPTERSVMYFSGTDFTTGAFLSLVNPMPVSVTNFTWSVQFQGLGSGLGGTDEVGVDLYSPPVVGQHIEDYWEYNGVSWSLKTNVYPMNFGAVFEAIPEPSTVLLGVFGGLVLLGMSRWIRRK